MWTTGCSPVNRQGVGKTTSVQGPHQQHVGHVGDGRQEASQDGGICRADGPVLAVVQQPVALVRGQRVAEHGLEVLVAGVLGGHAQRHAHDLAQRFGEVVADGAAAGQLRGREDGDLLPVDVAERERAGAQRFEPGRGAGLDMLGEHLLGAEVRVPSASRMVL